MAAELSLADLHARQMNTLQRLRAAYDLNMKALRAAAPADRAPRKELEEHLADAINLMHGCVYTVSHAISNAEASERNAGVRAVEAPSTPQIVLEALQSCTVGGYRDVDGDWCERRWFDKDKVDAAIKALAHGVSVVPPARLTPEQELMRQRLFSPAVGQQCIFDARGGWPYQVEEAKRKLVLEGIYTVAKVEVHSAHTRVWLVDKGEGYEDWFNSMLFRPAGAKGPEHE